MCTHTFKTFPLSPCLSSFRLVTITPVDEKKLTSHETETMKLENYSGDNYENEFLDYEIKIEEKKNNLMRKG